MRPDYRRSSPLIYRMIDGGMAALATSISLSFPAGRQQVRLRRRLPSWRRNRTLPARAKPHGPRLLANQTRRVGLCDLLGTGPASQQIDPVTNAPGLLKI
jgi:hypothetical protein